MYTRLLAKLAVHAALLSCLPLFGQDVGQAFQATLTKASNTSSTSIFMDLPIPPFGRRLTVKRVSVKVGPAASPYAQLAGCYIESDRPAIPDVEFLEKRTRVFLPTPELSTVSGDKVWHIRDAGTLIYYDTFLSAGRGFFRLTCDAAFMLPATPITVTVTGYTTPIQ